MSDYTEFWSYFYDFEQIEGYLSILIANRVTTSTCSTLTLIKMISAVRPVAKMQFQTLGVTDNSAPQVN